MKINMKSIFGVLLLGAAMLTACSEDYLETKPTHVLDQESVNDVMQADPAQVQAYVTGALLNTYCGGDYWTSHDDFGIPAFVKWEGGAFWGDIRYNSQDPCGSKRPCLRPQMRRPAGYVRKETFLCTQV